MTIVVDASVVVKWYIPERDHETARDLRDEYLDGDDDLAAPALLAFEVVNALRYSGYYEGERLVEASETLPGYGIELEPDGRLGPVAAIANELDVPINDASYVSLAETRDATAYTADASLLRTVEETDYSARLIHTREYD